MAPESTAGAAAPELSPAKRALLAAILGGQTRAPGISRIARLPDLPVSFAQERLWFLDRLGGGDTAYNLTEPLRLSGMLEEAALERALGEVVRRHEALRTVFREVDGVPRQVVAPFRGFPLSVEDLSGLGVDEREARLRRRVAEEAAHRFDLAAEPLFRATLLRLGPGERVLLLSMHHVVCDGWSLRVLFRELWALYAAFRQRRPSPLPEPTVQYADYAAWQRSEAGTGTHERELAYWKARLAGAPELMDLPADRPRPPRPSLRGAAVPVRVPASVARPLRELARREGATLFMVALAAFQVVLARWAGQGDVVVGTPVAGRTRREVEEMIGLFMNTLVLRTDLSGDPSFREAVGRARETVLGAFDHQEVPFERVVAELQPRRTLSHPPLFQLMFQLDEEAASAGGPEGLRVAGVEEEAAAAKFDLTLALSAGAGGIGGMLLYAADLFDRPTAERMVDHLGRVLEQAAADPALPLSRIELMGDAERRRVVEEWSGTEPAGPAACIHALFEARAAEAPGAVALVFDGQSLTYGDLDALAGQLANHLLRLGAGPEARVAICLERSAAMVAAMLAVLKAGAAYLPLDPAYPADRLAYMLEDSGASILVTQSSLRGILPAEGVRVVDLDADAERIGEEPAEAQGSAVEPGNAAYVIYTSGSTGRPKGVAVTHANVASFFAGMDGRVGGRIPGTWLAVTRTGFDIHVLELLWTLARGFRVVVHPDVARSGGAGALAGEIRRHGVTHLQCTPSLASVLVAESGAEALAGLDRLLLGGEPLPAALAAEVTAALPNGLLNVYGPTETTVWSTTHDVSRDDSTVPIGRPIAGTRAYVLDPHLHPQPAGVPGELFLGGPGVTRGYPGRPGLTAERFLPDPFSADPGARLYRTGDRARWRDGGVLECLGRVDQQVKVRGFRVEPGEIEAALRLHPGVRECVVIAREDRPGDRRLAAYLVADADVAKPDALRAHLRGLLPDYMVPASFTHLPALPLLPNGKLDRAALPHPAEGRSGPEADEPRDYLEARLIQVWEALLGVSGIGPTQGFFDLGGDSFLALHLFARVNRAFGCDLPVATLFSGGTVRHMADAIRELGSAAPGQGAPVVALQPGGSLPPLFVVHAVDRGVMGYVNLVRHLGADQPVFGLRDTGELSRPVARIAAEHLAAVRTVQPRGPYSLVGWSFGGTVAYEMAVQLEREGDAVAFLGLLDTLSPVLVETWPLTSELELATALAREVAGRMRRPFTPPDGLEGLAPAEQVRRVGEALLAQDAAPPGFVAEALAEQCRDNRARDLSRAGHAPGRFSGTLTLFRAGSVAEWFTAFLAPYGDEERRTLAWSRYAAGPVEVHEVPGTHATLGSEPHVRVLAERMRASLAAARERATVRTGAAR